MTPISLKQVLAVVNEWLKSDDVYVTDGEGGPKLPNAWIDCVKGSLLKRLCVVSSPATPEQGLREDKLRNIAWIAWKGAANAYRMYPDNKHTFTEYWDAAKDQFNEYLVEFIPPSDQYKEALETIANPIEYLRKEAEKDDGKLDGMYAQQLAKDSNWLNEIARKALSASAAPAQEHKQPSLKIEFTNRGELDENIPESDKWMAQIDELKMIVTAPTREQAFEEIMTSLRVRCAFASNYDLKNNLAERKGKEEILHGHVKNIYLFNHSNAEKREELKSAIYAAMDEYAASHLTGKEDWVKIETDANLPLAEDVCLWIHIPNEYYPHCGSMLDEDFPGIDKFNHYFKITNEFFPKPIY